MALRKFALAAVMAAGVALPAAAQTAMEQFIPVLIYRTGPYAAGGTGLGGGIMDYMAMLNERDGGINGVKLTWEECETAYANDRGVECYERLKGKGGGAALVNPWSTGITYALIDRVAKDKIPLMSLGYGRTDASDGRVFPWVFPAITNYWSQNTAKIQFIAMKEGGLDKLKGKKIANLYHDSAYGKETIPVLDKQAAQHGFTVQHFAVAHPGLDQKAVWLNIARQFQPDWVILRGWGVMNPTALKEAARVGFKADKIVGVWWSGSEEDVIPAGNAAKGYIAAGFHPSGKNFPVIQDILEHVHGKGKGHIESTRVGSIYYNRGVITGLLAMESIRTAQEKYGKKALSGEQVRWGMEHLDLTAAKLEKLGFKGMLAPMKMSCTDHEGGGGVQFLQWDGDKWNPITDFLKTDQKLVRPMVEQSAAAYAKEKSIAPRDCSKEG